MKITYRFANGETSVVEVSEEVGQVIMTSRRKEHADDGCRDIKSSEEIHDWNEGKIQVGLLHPMAGAMGLNIQSGGHILIWFGLTWSLELYQQTNARLWRQGQKEVVTIYHIVAKDTVDEDVLVALEQKDCTQERLIAAVKARLEE